MLLNALRYAVATRFLGVDVPTYILYFAGIAVLGSVVLNQTQGMGVSIVFLAASAAILLMAGVLTGMDLALVAGLGVGVFAVRIVLKAVSGL